MGQPKIRVCNISKVFYQKKKGKRIVAIEQLDFDVNEGEYLVIVGETGAGKSVFFDCLLGLKEVSSGEILIDNKPAEDYAKKNVGKITRIFQEDRLLPWRTATENVKLGLEIAGVDKDEQIRTAQYWLKQVGLAGFEHSYPNELSGGMRQRVNIARAFATKPEILLLDEAFGGLDEVTATRLRRDFISLAHSQKMTFLMVTHLLEEALELGDRILIFGSPARLVGEMHVPPDVSKDPVLFREYHGKIKHLIENEGRIAKALQ